MSQRDRIALGVVACLAVLVGFWFGVLSPKRAEVSKLNDQVAEQESVRDQAVTDAALGERSRGAFGRNYATVARLGKAVPVGDQTASLLYQLETTADRHSVDFRSLKVGASAAALAAPGPAAGAPATPATPAATATAPAGAAVGPAAFPKLPYDLTFDGSFFDVERFLSSVERYTRTSSKDVAVRGRLLTIDAVSLTASRHGFPDVKANVVATAYVLPEAEGAFGGATPGAPAGAPVQAGGGAPSGGSNGSPSVTASIGVRP